MACKEGREKDGLKELVFTLLSEHDAKGLIREDEWSLAQHIVNCIEGLRELSDEPAPLFLALRVEELLVTHFLVRRIEEPLWRDGVFVTRDVKPRGQQRHVGKDETTGDTSSKDTETAAVTTAVHPAVEAGGKLRERRRKAMKDLEEALPKMTPSASKGLPTLMRPILKQGEGVLEEALAFEARKKKRKAAAGKNK